MLKTKKEGRSLASHGLESWLSKHELRQHKYMGGDTGFIEVIQVYDSIKGKPRFYIHNYHAYSHVSSFSEWSTLEFAIEAYMSTGGLTLNIARSMYMQLAGFIQMTDCQPGESPWFYETE